MAFKSFVIPVFHSEWAERELNRFLQSHRVVSVERGFVEQRRRTGSGVVFGQAAFQVDHRHPKTTPDPLACGKRAYVRRDWAALDGGLDYTICTKKLLVRMANGWHRHRTGSGVVFGQAVFHVSPRHPKTTPDPLAHQPSNRNNNLGFRLAFSSLESGRIHRTGQRPARMHVS
jgi:hypothetical protein